MKSISEKEGLGIGRCILNLVTAFAITAILVLAFALFLCYSDVGDEWIARGAKIINIFSVALAGALCAKSGRRSGWLVGGVSGILYTVVLYALGYAVFGSVELGPAVLIKLAYGALAGIVGGIIGINLKK